jgi:hypothetical protein
LSLALQVAMRLVIAGLALIRSQCAVRADAWTLPAGTGEIIASAAWSAGRQPALAGTQPNSRAIKRQLEPYLEYGLTEWLTGIVQTGLLSNHLDAPNRASYLGLDYSKFALRGRLLDLNGFSVAVQGGIEIPGPASGSPAQFGNNGPETDFRLAAGYSGQVWARPVFVEISTGYQTRANPQADSFRLDLSLGTRLHENWLILLQAFTALGCRSNLANLPRQNEAKLQPSLVFDISKSISLQMGLIKTIPLAKAYQETGIITGLWYHF